MPQYYVEGNHPAIIDPEVFGRVQILMAAKTASRNRTSYVSIFSGSIKCADCGSWYGSKVWHSNDKYRRVIWQCNHKFDGQRKCSTPHLDEDTIKALFIKALNIFCTERDEIIAAFDGMRQTAFQTDSLEAEQRRIQKEMNVVADMIQRCIAENAHVALDQEEYGRRYNELAERYDGLKGQLDKVSGEIAEKLGQREMMDNFVKKLDGLPELVDSFDETAWYSLVDYITVYSKDDIRFTFKNGSEIAVQI